MGRNIILLSDGTGASSISPQKSNVWRLFESLDLGPEYHQIAFYDDGVGTSGFKPLRLIGGAFGWGLSRNVRDLYRKLCRHYQPGDRIYIFGFSRGAFTARVLAHFIGICGILDRSKPAPGGGRTMETERGLIRGVRKAYKSYRRSYWDSASAPLKVIARALRGVRNLSATMNVPPPDVFKQHHSFPSPENRATIEFVGVWDTVDALGLPVAELTLFIDRWLYPYKFPNQKLSCDVGRARQALAIDDERQTFHPLLWDEGAETDPDRIRQVWFAGMHSNVGGGYPEDHLAYITLDWMIGEVKATAERPGLIFNEEAVQAIRQKAEPLGKMYDSRRGAAVYYRYLPRNIGKLCRQRRARLNGRNRVRVSDVTVHHSVLDRIGDLKVGYAPIALPSEFRIVGRDGAPRDPRPGERYYESDEDRAVRSIMMERAQGHVFWRRCVYFCLLAVTLILLLLPLLRPSIPGMIPAMTGKWWWDYPTLVVGFAFDHAAGFLPGYAHYWTEAWSQSATLFTVLAAVFALVFAWSYWVESNTHIITEAGWWHLKGNPSPRYDRPPRSFEALATWLRHSALGHGILWLYQKVLLPVGFSFIAFYLALGISYRLIVHYPTVSDGVCTLPGATSAKDDRQDLETLKAGASKAFKFPTSHPCLNTGIEMEAGRRYRIAVAGDAVWNEARTRSFKSDPFCRADNSNAELKDDTVPATPKGFVCYWRNLDARFLFGLPARRELFLPWYSLIGEIERDSGYVFPINRRSFEFVPSKSGTLYLYVNDAINSLGLPIPNTCALDAAGKLADPECMSSHVGWDAAYRNNKGIITVKVTKVKPGVPEDDAPTS